MSEGIRPFNIMAKPVSGVCNLNCTYCYYTAKPQELYPGVKKFLMGDDVLAAFTKQYMDAIPKRCGFHWQGGEPLLAGVEFFRRAVSLQGENRRAGQAVTNALQTNGTLLDEQWCEFFAEHKFLIGISIDGPAQWHDYFRRDRAGKATFGRAWAGLELLRKHDVEFNVLATLNSANAPHAGDIYRYFVNRGLRHLQFIPILERNADGEPEDFSCTAERFGRFWLEVFRLWAERDVGKVSLRFFDSILQTIIHNVPAMCTHSQRCANAHVLEFNGDLYACDHFVLPEWRIGNVMARPMGELLRSPKLREFARLKTDLPAACEDCEFLQYCRGGCPKHHTPIGLDRQRVNYFCEGYKMFFRAALPELKRIAEYVKLGQLPSRKAPPPGARPGRNDPCPCGSGRKFKNCCGRTLQS